MMSLASIGDSFAEIRELKVSASSAQRLKSLGIFEGQRVSLCKTGSPLIVAAAGGRVAIAQEVAELIMVEMVSGKAA